MANYSTMGKWLVAFATVGAGTTGTVIGASNLKRVKENTTTNFLSSEKGGKKDSVKNSESINNEVSSHSDGDVVKGKGEPSIKQTKLPDNNLGKIVSGDDLSLKGSYSAEAQEEKGKLTETSKENTATKKDQVVPEPEKNSSPVATKAQSPAKVVNWFSIELGELDFLHENSWTIKECQKIINQDQAVFKCLWDWEYKKSPITINFYLFSSTNSDLSNKRWDDVTELSLTPDGDEKATLGLTFSGNGEQEIELSLVKK